MHNAANQDDKSKVSTQLQSESFNDIENLRDTHSLMPHNVSSPIILDPSNTVHSIAPLSSISSTTSASSTTNSIQIESIEVKSNITKQSSSQQSAMLNRRRQQQQQQQQQQRQSQTMSGKGRKDNRWFKLYHNMMLGGEIPSVVSLGVAVLLWYLLGVVSIGTTKLLLNHGVPPFYLTFQQLLLGSNLLRFVLQNHKSLGSSGLIPWPTVDSSLRPSSRRNHSFLCSLLLYVLQNRVIAFRFSSDTILPANQSNIRISKKKEIDIFSSLSRPFSHCPVSRICVI
jgi:hypothetical protein